ncbi:MAG: DUF4166 domain-containing protein [Caulobacter sp.]|nr:DUF4166 domain-containing protein [Caulobacter sp.]
MAGSDPVSGRPHTCPSLYARLLGGAWPDLPEPLRRMHALEDALSAAGRAKVERGAGALANVVAALVGFPPASDDVAVRVDFERRGDLEIWRRRFGDQTFHSRQQIGREQRLVESFGPAAFAMTLTWDGRRLNLRLRQWRFLGIPMPDWSAPVSTAYEEVIDGRFSFFVEISHPWTGLIVRYSGWLEPIIVPARNLDPPRPTGRRR